MKKAFINFFIICFLLVIAGCQLSHAPIRSNLEIPDDYNGNHSDITMADTQWEEFFIDTNLVKLISIALRNNRDLKSALKRIEIASANFRITQGAFIPTLNQKTTAGVYRYPEYTINGIGNLYTNESPGITEKQIIPNPTPNYFFGFRSVWEIDIWRKLRSRKQAALQRFLASRNGARLIKTALVAQIASLYYELLAYDNELSIIKKNIQLQETALGIVQLQKMGGRATELAVKQFTAQLLNTKSLVAGIQQKIIRAEAQINALAGRFPQPVQRGEPINSQILPKEVFIGVPSEILKNRPDIKQAAHTLKAADRDVYAAKAAMYPSLIISAYEGYQAYRGGLLLSTPTSLGFGLLGGLTAPILNNYKLRSNLKIASASNYSAIYQYEQSILTAFREVYTSLKAIENLKNVAEFQAQEVEVLQQAIAIANDLFIAGYATYLEVVTAQKKALQAELQLTNTRKEQFLAVIELYRVLGGGWK